MVQTGGVATIKIRGTKIGIWNWSANREKEKEKGTGIGIITVAVVVVAAEDITTMKDMVRIVVVMGMGGRLTNGGDDDCGYALYLAFSFDCTVFYLFCSMHIHSFLINFNI